MNLFAGIVVIASSLFLIGLACVMLVNPVVTERFILLFASSARAHYTEMTFRLLFGVSLMLLSRAMWQPDLFLVLGTAIVISSVALLIMPWQWHHRLGIRVLPTLIRYMRIYALGVLAFGALLLYGALPVYLH